MVASLIVIIPSCLHNPGLQITTEWNIQSLNSVKTVVERQDMAHSICLAKLYRIRQWKNFCFLFLTTLTDLVAWHKIIFNSI